METQAGRPLPAERLTTGIEHIRQIGGTELADTLPRLLAGLPDAVTAVNLLDRFLRVAPPAAFYLVRRDLSLLQALLMLLSHSQFLAESLIQAPEQVLWLHEARRVDRVRTRDELAAELATFTAPALPEERTVALTRFKRREYLRIVLRDLLGLSTLAETTQELSHLADALLVQAYVWAWNDLVTRFGAPIVEQNGQEQVAEMAVIGLGKLGGEELNYSSDVDLMFIYSGEGETDARTGAGVSTTNREFFIRMAQQITRSISRVTREGAAYRVDLRLRPGGGTGDVALSLRQAMRYYQGEARDWEWQMLIRARHCAGSAELSHRFLRQVESFVYRPGHGAEAVRSVLEARERISAQLERHRARGRRSQTLDVKLDPGGIRDIEFLIQGLQRMHGGNDRWVRTGNTLVAMQRLHDKGYLSGPEMQQLSSAHWLLRNVEHRLQLYLGQQTHSLPETPERMQALALSLLIAEGGRRNATWLAGYQADPEAEANGGERLVQEIEAHMAVVRTLYEAKIGVPAPAAPRAPQPDAAVPLTVEGSDEMRLLAQEQEHLSRHGQQNLHRLFVALGNRADGSDASLRLSGRGRAGLLRVLGESDFLTELLLRRPALISRLDATPGLPDGGKGAVEKFEEGLRQERDYRRRMGFLRRWYQEQLFCLIAGELGEAKPIREMLQSISRLAGQALEFAVRIATEEEPGSSWPDAMHGFAVLALGRLGLEEFDILSDVDLIFIAPDPEHEAAHRLARRVIDVITAYMQDGMLFAIDTRLRTGGGEGELVQSPAAVENYFRERAGAWEAVSYLKARPVAGDRAVAAEAMERWRPVLYERFGDGARLRPELRQMRDRIENESRQGRKSMKTGKGGYYDIDFALSCRALQHPEVRLEGLSLAEIARRLAGLDGSGAPPLIPADSGGRLAEGATLLRAADHAMRVVMGKAPATPPESGHAAERSQALMSQILGRPMTASVSETIETARREIRGIYLELMEE